MPINRTRERSLESPPSRISRTLTM